jgi:hypothetical protein
MGVLRVLAKILAALVVLGVVAFFAPRFVRDGPIGPIPGGPLRAGELVASPVTDWSFARDVLEIELQLESQGISRTTWILVRDGAAWVPCSLGFPPGKTWYEAAQRDGRAILRIEGRRYPVQLTRDDDRALADFARAEVERKYVNPPPGDAGALFFRVTSRS